MPLDFVKKKLESVGCTVKKDKSDIEVTFHDETITLSISDDWKKEIRSFLRSNQYSFDCDNREMIGPREVEYMVAPLGDNIFYRTDYTFKSNSSRLVKLAKSSSRFQLYFFNSDEYEKFFEALVYKIFKRKKRKYYFDEFLWAPRTISYHVPRKQDRSQLLSEGFPKMEACLFKLARENDECWDFKKRINKNLISKIDEFYEDDLSIPLATYDSNLVKYFKVAISSQFPSQSFLAFYHVLEYNFLKVSDEVLHGRLRSHVGDTRFQGNFEEIDKIISIVKKHSGTSDETEMLMRVLRKYVDEEELIDFIVELETQSGEKIYSKTREVFGERFHIQTKKDQAIASTAKLIKHIRNALVHSSDRYNREDCHIPLTDSEFVVQDYIPLIRFLSEKVICSKSS